MPKSDSARPWATWPATVIGAVPPASGAGRVDHGDALVGAEEQLVDAVGGVVERAARLVVDDEVRLGAKLLGVAAKLAGGRPHALQVGLALGRHHQGLGRARGPWRGTPRGRRGATRTSCGYALDMTKSMSSSASHSRAARPTSASEVVRRSPDLRSYRCMRSEPVPNTAAKPPTVKAGCAGAVVEDEARRRRLARRARRARAARVPAPRRPVRSRRQHDRRDPRRDGRACRSRRARAGRRRRRGSCRPHSERSGDLLSRSSLSRSLPVRGGDGEGASGQTGWAPARRPRRSAARP